MNNKKSIVVSILVLIALLSATIFGCSSDKNNSDKTENNTDIVKEFNPEIITKIEPKLGEHDYIENIHVLDEGKRILIEVCKVVETEEENEDGSTYIVNEVRTVMYEWNAKSMGIKELNLDYSGFDGVSFKTVWNGHDIMFTGMEQLSGEFQLYKANLGNDGVTVENIQHIEMENKNITITNAVTTCEDKVLFLGKETTSEYFEYYVGKIKDGKLVDVKQLSDDVKKGISGNVKLFDNGTKLLNMISREYPIDRGVWLFDLSEDGSAIENKTKLNFDFITGDSYTMPVMDIDYDKDIIYYMDNENNVCKASLSATIEKAKNNAKENSGQSNNEKTEYKDGDNSSDAYDKGNFTSELREKSDEKTKQGVYYEIFVRSFADSDGDGIGDFNGITAKLDYLKELGIDGLWLMPINESPSYHGYDITDFMALNSDYGTEEDFKKLLDEAHARDIKVIMDFPINHTSSEHPWFKDIIENEDSQYKNYYRWVSKNDTSDYSETDVSNWGNGVWSDFGDEVYYALFGGHMPDLNYNNEAVREEMKKAASKWLEMGVDGFRLDAAMHIYGANEFKKEENPTQSTITWWNEFALHCESINHDVYLVGEAWQDDEILEEYVQPFDTKFNFTMQGNIINAITNGTAVTEEGKNISQVLQNILDTYDTVDTNYVDGIFGSNHDQERIMSTVKDVNKAKQVAAVYMTLPGNPFVYYGEELGMQGKKPDQMIRTPFLWGEDNSYTTSWTKDNQNNDTATLEEQMNESDSMYSFYKNIIALRKNHTALFEGTYKAVDLGNDGVMAYIRESGDEKLLVIHNFKAEAQNLDLQGYEIKNIVFATDKKMSGDVSDDKLEIGGNDSVILLLGK